MDPDVLGTISGRVTLDGSVGLSGVQVSLRGVYDDSTFTVAGGGYQFQRVAGGSYVLTVAGLPEGMATLEAQRSASVSSNGETVTVDFDARRVPLPPDALCVDHSAASIGSFADAGLEAAVVAALGNGSGGTTCSALAVVTAVGAASKGIGSLIGIQNLVAIRTLDVSDNAISDLAPLASLTTLIELELDGNSIVGVSALSGLTALARLELARNAALTDIGPLLANPGLGSGDVVGLKATGVSCAAVESLEARGVVVRSDCAASEIDPDEFCSDHDAETLASFADPDLEAAVRAVLSLGASDDITCGRLGAMISLSAPSAGIGSLAGLQNLTALETLDLSDNAIRDLGELAGLVRLRTLRLEENAIASLDPLAGLSGLRELYLFDNAVSDLGPLSALTGLDFLDIQWNAVSDIGAVSGLTALSTLFAGGNSVADLSPLSGLVNLDGVAVNDNPISDFRPLSGLVNLTFLGVSRTGLVDVGWAGSLTRLEHFWLSGNQVTDVSALLGMTAIRVFNLSENYGLSNIQPLLSNTGLGSGDQVDLRSTAVSCLDVAALRAKGVVVSSGCS